MDLVDPHIGAHIAAFRAHRIKRIGAPETRGLPKRFAFWREVIDVFHAERAAEHCALLFPDRIGRRRMERTTSGQFLVGVTNGKAALIVLARLVACQGRRHVTAEAGHIHGEDIACRLALDHPFGQCQPDTAALAEPGHHGTADPEPLQAGHTPDQGIAVARKGEGAVDDGLDARLGE